jgi:tRNA(fMet)-specific endonuclease VapC
LGILLDSSILIEAERGRLDLDLRLEAAGAEPVAISSITASELLHGVHRAVTARDRIRREEFVEGLIGKITIADFGLREARVHAAVWADLRSRGVMIGAHDLLIAATALALEHRLATANLRDFTRIPDLKIEHWNS